MINIINDFFSSYSSGIEFPPNLYQTSGWLLTTATIGLLGVLYLGYKRASSSKSMSTSHIAVLVQKYPMNDGTGDIVIGEKLLAILKKAFSTSSRLFTITPEDKYTEDFFNKRQMDYVSFEKLQDQVKTSSTLVIHTPVLQESFTLDLGKKSQAIHIGEYSNEGIVHSSMEQYPYSLGVGPNEWGIFCDKERLAQRKEISAKGMEYDLQPFKNAKDCSLKQEILGKATVEEYEKYSRMYSGYVWGFYSVRNFLLPVAYYEKENEQNIDVVITGDRLIDSELLPRLLGTLNKVKENFGEAGIKELEIVVLDEKTEQFTKYSIVCKEKNSKKMRLFLPGIISKEMKHAIEMGSVPFRLATGDNSLSEALGIAFLYEDKGPKTASFNHLKALAKNLKLFLVEEFLSKAIFKGDDSNLIDYEKVAELFKNPALKKEWIVLADYIHEHCNVEDILTQNVQDIFSGKFDPEHPKTVTLPK